MKGSGETGMAGAEGAKLSGKKTVPRRSSGTVSYTHLMSFVMPGSDLMRKAASYVEPVLHPFRQLLYRYFPRLRTLPVDLSPLAVWLVIDVVTLLLNMLRRAVI